MFALPKEILIATNNRGKFREISQLLDEINIKALPSFDLNIEEPEETGSTFEENSILKAKYYAKKANLTALADDSGLCIKALDNKPGIHSARFAQNEEGQRDFYFAFKKIEEQLNKITPKPQDYLAHFICNLTIFDPKTNFHISFEGRVDGKLIFPPRGDKGFGYDPIFIKNGMDQTFGEIDPKLKDKISHRGHAFEKLINWCKTNC